MRSIYTAALSVASDNSFILGSAPIDKCPGPQVGSYNPGSDDPLAVIVPRPGLCSASYSVSFDCSWKDHHFFSFSASVHHRHDLSSINSVPFLPNPALLSVASAIATATLESIKACSVPHTCTGSGPPRPVMHVMPVNSKIISKPDRCLTHGRRPPQSQNTLNSVPLMPRHTRSPGLYMGPGFHAAAAAELSPISTPRVKVTMVGPDGVVNDIKAVAKTQHHNLDAPRTKRFSVTYSGRRGAASIQLSGMPPAKGSSE
ncbi:hypothetical protein Tco_0683103 [Tanacetum coccineum]|uniref:Uncharacterized protein n=1 Tax=Tanacetum coccineum TaxID=301880 RepID=A0ABQ4XUZ4_9ASTR